MRTPTLALALAVFVAACSDSPTRVTSPTPRLTASPAFTTVIGTDGNPVPGGSDRLFVDTRSSLQQATSLAQAWALFPGDDHSPARGSRGRTGWSFTTDFDGQGTHALRADWHGTGSSCSDRSVRIIDYLPTPRPKQLFVQWKQRLGRTSNDADANGDVGIFQTENASCPRAGRYVAAVMRDNAGGSDHGAVWLWWRGSPRQPAVEQNSPNAFTSGNQGWTFLPQQSVGQTIVTTLFLQAESAPGKGDGAIRVWMNGRLYLERTNVRLGTNAFHRFQFPDWFGAPRIDEAEYFWDVVAWEPTAVVAPPPTVARVSVSPATGRIDVGSTLPLTATAFDANGNQLSGQTVAWSSSDSNVARVSNAGLVTGVRAGTAVVSAAISGTSGSASVEVTAISGPPPTPAGCATPQAGWIWCDDFEQDHTSSYFEYVSQNGSFTRQAGGGVNGSTSIRARWTAGQVGAGSLKLAFGRAPDPYFRAVDAGTANYRELFWRVYVKSQAGWRPNGNDKFTRAMVIAKSDWSEAAIGHVWSGGAASSQSFYVLDPASGTDQAGNVLTVGYNDFAHMTWLGAAQATTPVFGSGTGQWYCVEAHMRLNDASQSNGVFELWINGNAEARRTGLNWLGNYSAYGINALFLENFINNGSPQAQVRDYDELVVSTQRIGCISQSTGGTPPPAVASVNVRLTQSNLAAGQTTAVIATTQDAAGNALTGRNVSWSSSNTNVATVSPSGGATATVTAVGTGTANIIATSEGIAGQAVLTVPAPPPPATAASVTLLPSSLPLVSGARAPLTAIVRDANGTLLIGHAVTWQSTNGGIAALSAMTNTGVVVTGGAQGTATISATVDGVVGTASVTVSAAPPPPPPPPGEPSPAAGATILMDLRQTLQQAPSLTAAFALFPGDDHTPARGGINGSGWSFTTNFDGHGTHALRADWSALPSGDQGVRIISYFSAPKPHELYVQFKGYLGKHPADADGNGTDNTFPLFPQSNSVKRFLMARDGVSGGSLDRIDYVWTRENPSAARVQMDDLNWGFNSSPTVWQPNTYLGRVYTTTIYFKASSANGVKDGIYRIWIDGTLVLNASNVVLDGYGIDRFHFPDTSHNFPIPTSEYYWDFLIWTP